MLTEEMHAPTPRASWLRRTIAAPVLRMLRHGASPRRLAWSLAVGIVIGINPVIGSATLAALAVAHLSKLNHTATQIGVQGAYPLQLLLLLPFLRAGSWLFGATALPMQAAELLTMVRQHPVQIVRLLWTWEWHALVVWAVAAAIATPLLAMGLRHVLERTMTRRTHTQAT
jgi:uncharacterized protein (DUF2062 family)